MKGTLIAQIFQGSEGPNATDTSTGISNIANTLEGSGITGTGSFIEFVIRSINFILPYVTLAAFVGFVYAGILYVTAFGNDEQIQKSKKIMIFAAIGIVVVIVSFAIVQFLTTGLTDFIAEPSN